MVGDRPETDGLMAATLGCRYAHVESGVTAPGTVVDADAGPRSLPTSPRLPTLITSGF